MIQVVLPFFIIALKFNYSMNFIYTRIIVRSAAMKKSKNVDCFAPLVMIYFRFLILSNEKSSEKRMAII